MKVVVMNPPHRRRKVRTHRKASHRRRKVSAASLAALKKINARRAGKKVTRRTVRRATRRRLASSALGRLTRPRLYRRRKRLYRGRKSTLPPMMRLSNPTRNPWGGELLTMGNPGPRAHKRKVSVMAHRKKHRRARRRHSLMFRNPLSPAAILSKPREMISKEFLTEAVSAAAGFVLPQMAMAYVPASLKDTKLKYYASKVAVVALASTAVSAVNKKVGRMILLGGGISLALDALSEVRARFASAPAGGVNAYYGDGINAYYGDGINGPGDVMVAGAGDVIMNDGDDVGNEGF